ncbi:PREDICTED: IQ domain-containing protein C [Gavialis gangeticus]|uniref:IQ domain-containing protein C n=1 Tax=Gavialis gangeticus TaxID=94835 RepID=UPI00092E80C9|nr:PREDICTED: IQ domain-containing protein C [Gavialis gangeticus]
MGQEPERLRGAVAALQAHVRGYLVRKRFRSLREEYESAVMEIEGGLDRLRWKGGLLPRPVFLQEKQVKAKRLIGQEAVSKDQSASDKEQQKLYPLETLEPEKDCDSQGIANPAGQLHGEEVPLGSDAGGVRLNPQPEAETPTGLDCCLPGESSEWKNCSNVSSVWSSTILETGSAGASQELSFGSMEKELPETLPELQCYRKHLAMEMLWLQQAIASRKNYLILKQRLGAPER